jgi:hypothetical protein
MMYCGGPIVNGTTSSKQKASINILFGPVWFQTKCSNYHPNAATTIVAPGATRVATQATQLRWVESTPTLWQRQHYHHASTPTLTCAPACHTPPPPGPLPDLSLPELLHIAQLILPHLDKPPTPRPRSPVTAIDPALLQIRPPTSGHPRSPGPAAPGHRD